MRLISLIDGTGSNNCLLLFSGSHLPGRVPAAVLNARSGDADQDGLCQPGHGVCAQLPALHLAGSACHPGQCAQGDDLHEVPHPKHGHATSQRYAVMYLVYEMDSLPVTVVLVAGLTLLTLLLCTCYLIYASDRN